MKIHPLFLHLICWSIVHTSFAQKNILRNGGFEEHGEQICLSCDLSSERYTALVYHWDNGGWNCRLCDTNYKQQSDERKAQVCPFDRIRPQSGQAMISMAYLPGTNGIFGGVEGATHLSARTTEPMRVGQLYEISLWFFIQASRRPDPDWGKHLGIALLPQNLSYFNGRKPLIMPFIGVDTVVYGQWYQAKWRVRPLCTSNYLMIGVFADPEWPKSRSFSDIHYFVDNVSVVERPESPAVSDSSVYYCSRYDPVVLGALPRMDTKFLLYENDSYQLTAEHRAVLDSFGVYAKTYPELVFQLSGHTDSTGNDNFALSQKRVRAVYDYLTEVLHLPRYRFYTVALGSTAPYRPNSTEEGRKLNRRSEISQSTLTLSMMFYRGALKAVRENNKAEAFSYLDKWIAKEEKGSLLLLLFDPRFASLRMDKRWLVLEKKVRDSYKSCRYAKESFLIDSLRLDACRLAGIPLAGMLNGLPGTIPEEEEDYAVALPWASDVTVLQRYQEHYARLFPLLKKTGWPKKDAFSESAVNNAFHILLRSRDVIAYLFWLPVLQEACEAGELPWIMYATCYDQSRLCQGKPQRYLTEYQVLVDGRVILPRYEGNAETINDHRAKIGLSLLPQIVVDAMRQE